MSNPFRKMRALTDKKLDGALTDHQEWLARLIIAARRQNRWNVGMVLSLVIAYIWLGVVSFTPQHVGYVPVAGVTIWAVIFLVRRIASLRQ